MKLLVISIVLALSFASEEFPYVLTVNDSNIDDAIKTNPVFFLKFYAPWCGHCKHLAPEYGKAADIAKGKKYVFAEIDTTQNEKSSQKYEIQGFPTLKLFINGSDPIDYNGERTSDGILTWIDKMLLPPYTALTAMEYSNRSSPIVVMVEPKPEQLDNLTKLARSNMDYKFYTIDRPGFEMIVNKSTNVSMVALIGFKREAFAMMRMDKDFQNVQEKIHVLDTPFIAKFDQETAGKMMKTTSVLLLGSKENFTTYEATLEECSKKHEELLFVTVDVADGVSSRLISFLGINTSPALVFFKITDNVNTKHMDSTFHLSSAADFESQYNKYQQNLLQRFFKSEVINNETENNSKDFKKIVWNTYASLNGTKENSILIFEAGHYASELDTLKGILLKLKKMLSYEIKMGTYNILDNELEGIKIPSQTPMWMVIFKTDGTQATMSESLTELNAVYEFLHKELPGFNSPHYIGVNDGVEEI